MANFREVLRAEKEGLDSGRRAYRKPDSPRVGLAFSGGGIRSATFNLGVLQGLARCGLLRRLDYLSTVSGGGYIGSWLASWVKRSGLAKVEEKLGEYESHRDPDGPVAEPKPVNFLRDYSNYLTPRKGIFGGDTWAAIGTYLRNLLLNQTILITFLAAVLLLPWALGKAFARGPSMGDGPAIFGVVAGVLAAAAVAWGVYNTAYCSGGEQPWFTKQKWVLLAVVTPLFAAAFLLNLALWSQPGLWSLPVSMGLGLAAYGGGHLIGWLLAALLRRKQPGGVPSVGVVLWSLPAGAFAGLEVYGLSLLLFEWKALTAGAQAGAWPGMWHGVSWGPPLFVVAFLLAGALHIGLAKFGLPNEMQEWWGRLGGWLLLLSVAWAGLFGLAVFVPWATVAGSAWIKTKVLLVLGWAGSSAAGLLSGRSAKTSGAGGGDAKRELIALISPYVFVVGLMALLSVGVHRLAIENPFSSAPVEATSNASSMYWLEAQQISGRWVLVCLASLALISIFMACRVDINQFSMNLLYRNRLVRCYLGATRPETERRPNPFTGFDPNDDLLLSAFSSDAGYVGPQPIVCATLNVTHGERLAWQERKAESFAFTPYYCGFEFTEMHPLAEGDESYQRTPEYAYPNKAGGGVYLGTAVSISGAAASPNMGFHTSPPLAFLMTLFDVRLGWWLANPRYRNESFPGGRPNGGPPCSLLYLLCELFASTTDRSKYVYLSDGGHFENLAIYELVRRRCERIIACDAGADPQMKFDDLGNAIRKCRSDFGVEISLDTKPVALRKGKGFAKVHGVVGTIQYPKGENGEPAFSGELLYLKATMTRGVPRDVLAYRDKNPVFPHQTTADQWFDESQFESYRRLGLFSVESLAGPRVEAGKVRPLSIEAFFEAASEAEEKTRG